MDDDDDPVVLDEHRGMAAQKATEMRRLRTEVEAQRAALRQCQEELEWHFLAGASAAEPEPFLSPASSFTAVPLTIPALRLVVRIWVQKRTIARGGQCQGDGGSGDRSSPRQHLTTTAEFAARGDQPWGAR
jgi:hypothetical protein